MKKLVLLSIIMLSVSVLFAYSSDDLLAALKDKNIAEVQTILEDSEEDDTKLFEDLILDDVKKAVKKDDLDYAYSLAEVVLMYDFDNVRAQDMFTSIEKAKKSKAEVAAKEAEKERLRLEEEERQRQIEEFQAQKQKEEEAKIEHEKAVSTITKSNFPIFVGISPLSLDFINSDAAKEYTQDSSSGSAGNGFNFKYGAGLSGNIGFVHPYFLANLHLNYNFLFASTGKKGMKSDLETRVSVGSPIVSDIIRVSLGYNVINYINPDKSVLMQNTYGGLVGIGIEDVKFGDCFNFTAFLDFNSITFAVEEVSLAFDVDCTLRYDLPWKVLDMPLYVENNTVFSAYQISQKWEYSLATRFSVGVKINE